MRTNHTILLAVGVAAVAIMVVVAALNFGSPPTGDKKLEELTVGAFQAMGQDEGIDFILELMDQDNESVAVNGTAILQISDSENASLFENEFFINETDFEKGSNGSGNRTTVSWSIPYDSIDLSQSREGNLSCNLSFTTGKFNLTAVNDSVPLPGALMAKNNLFYRVAAPIDQEWSFADRTASAAITYEPWATYLSQKEVGKVLVRSGEMWPNHPSYVVIVDKTWAKNNPDLAARAIKAHMDAETWIQNALANPGSSEYEHLISVATDMSGWDSNVVIESLTHIKFAFELNDQSRDYLEKYVDGYMESGILSIDDLRTRGYQNSSAFANSYIDTGYQDMAATVEPATDTVGEISIGFVKGNLFMLPCAIALDVSIWGGQSAFEKYGLDVQLASPGGYNTSALVAQGLMKGNVDFGYIAICPAIIQHLKSGMKALIVSQMAAEGTALIIANDVFDIVELADKTVLTPGLETINHVFLMNLARDKGFILMPG